LLISEKARSRIADEQLGITAVHAQHLNRLVPGLVADFQKAHASHILDDGESLSVKRKRIVRNENQSGAPPAKLEALSDRARSGSAARAQMGDRFLRA
jgi:hypothetical protein